MNKNIGRIAAVLILGLAPLASAATDDENLAVSATVVNSCVIATSALAFGDYNPTAADADLSTGQLLLTCTKDATATLTLGQGANADTGSTDIDPSRRMASGGSFLSYELFKDSSRLTEWGNTEATGASHTQTSISEQSVTVYGKVAAGQNAPAGSYTDTVVATVTF